MVLDILKSKKLHPFIIKCTPHGSRGLITFNYLNINFYFIFLPQDEHRQHLEEVLVAQAVPGIRSVMAMNDNMKQTLHKYNSLAEQVCFR